MKQLTRQEGELVLANIKEHGLENYLNTLPTDKLTYNLAYFLKTNANHLSKEIEIYFNLPKFSNPLPSNDWLFNTTDKWVSAYYKYWSSTRVNEITLEKSSFFYMIEPTTREIWEIDISFNNETIEIQFVNSFQDTERYTDEEEFIDYLMDLLDDKRERDFMTFSDVMLGNVGIGLFHDKLVEYQSYRVKVEYEREYGDEKDEIELLEKIKLFIIHLGMRCMDRDMMGPKEPSKYNILYHHIMEELSKHPQS